MSPPLHLTITLTITFLSDWHIGTGGGRYGQVDALVCRDPESKLPYLPGKTIKGNWRDACEIIALALDAAQAQPSPNTSNNVTAPKWMDYVDLTFGKASSRDDQGSTEGSLQIDAAHFSPTDSAFLSSRYGKALTALRPNVKIDHKTGSAEAMALRIEERVAAGSVLITNLNLRLTNQPTVDACALALLVAGSKFVEYVGGNRRRGAGRCQWILAGCGDWAEQQTLLEHAPKQPAPLNPQIVLPEAMIAEQTNAAQVHRLTLRTMTPVVVPKAIAGNVVESRDELPGSDVLAALMPYFSGAPGIDVRALIASGQLRVSPGYPTGTQRTPLCFDMPKSGDESFHNLLHPQRIEGKQRKMLRGGYVSFDGSGGMQRYSVKKSVRMHATIDDAQQRPTEKVGGLFSYEAIAPDQTFTVHLVLPAGVSFTAQPEQLFRLGIARSTDYGSVKLMSDEASTPTIAGASSSNANTNEPNTELRKMVIHMHTPLLCLGDRLQAEPSVNGLRAELARSYASIESAIDWTKPECFLATERYDGWLRAINMPRPSLIAIAAGSVVRVCLKQAAILSSLQAELDRLQAEGLGQRRAEGFGRIEIDPYWSQIEIFKQQNQTLATTTASDASGAASNQEPNSAAQKTTAAASKCPEDSFHAKIWRRYWRDTIVRQANGNAETIRGEMKFRRDGLNTSQSGALLSVVQRMTVWPNDPFFKEFLEWAAKPGKRKDQWDKVLPELKGLLDLQKVRTLLCCQELPDDPELRLFAARSVLMTAIHQHRHMRDKEGPATPSAFQQGASS